MTGYVLSAIMVGIPAALGVYLAVRRGRDRRSVTQSASILFYAGTLSALFVFLYPKGILGNADYKFGMPAAFILGCGIGAVFGIVENSWKTKGNDKKDGEDK